MTIQVRCVRCGPVAVTDSWSRAATLAAVHVHPAPAVRSVAVFTRSEWRRIHPDYKTSSPRRVLHYDSDGSTILVPAVVEG